jgi:hypothetical protein
MLKIKYGNRTLFSFTVEKAKEILIYARILKSPIINLPSLATLLLEFWYLKCNQPPTGVKQIIDTKISFVCCSCELKKLQLIFSEYRTVLIIYRSGKF